MTATANGMMMGRVRSVVVPAVVAATFVLIVFSYLMADRAVSSWSHAMFAAGGPDAWMLATFIGLTHLVDPLPPLAAVGFVAIGARLAASLRPAPLLHALFAACVATLVAIVVKDQLKYAFGRLWPETWVNHNPSWIADGAYGFFPFHGGPGWSSFPSGHMTVVTAPMVVLMLAWPVLRPWAVVPIALVAFGLFGADYHFVSDMVAGVLLGALCAVLVWRTLSRVDGARPQA